MRSHFVLDLPPISPYFPSHTCCTSHDSVPLIHKSQGNRGKSKGLRGSSTTTTVGSRP